MSVESNQQLHWFCFTTFRPVTCVQFSLVLVIFTFVLIGHCDCGYFGFGFTTLNQKALYTVCKVKLTFNSKVLHSNYFMFVVRVVHIMPALF